MFSQLALWVSRQNYGPTPGIVTSAVFLQHFPGASACADAHNKPLFSQKQAGARCECTICVFCELYFLSYLMLIFLQIHQIPGYVARKRRQRNFQARGSALWRCRILGLCPVICLYCNSNATIPEWVANSAEGAFPVGRKSTKTEPGSATYVINNLGLKFSR